uniref:Uncharacterized protein n=1 Tax=Rhodnius prolixus TaxID=13249 RepID=T1HTK9_RHOPR
MVSDAPLYVLLDVFISAADGVVKLIKC